MSKILIFSLASTLASVACGSEPNSTNPQSLLGRDALAQYGLGLAGPTDAVADDATRVANDGAEVASETSSAARSAAREEGAQGRRADCSVLDQANDTFGAALGFVKASSTAVTDNLNGNLKTAKQAGQNAYESAAEATARLADRTQVEAENAAHAITGTLRSSRDEMAEASRRVGHRSVAPATGLKSTIADRIYGMGQWSLQTAQAAYASTQGFRATARAHAQAARDALGSGIWLGGRKVVDGSKAAGAKLYHGIQDTGGAVYGSGKDWACATCTGVQDAGHAVYTGSKHAVDAVWARSRRATDQVADSSKEVVQGAADTLGTLADGVQTEQQRVARVLATHRVQGPALDTPYSRAATADILALHVCTSLADHTQQGDGFVDACRQEQITLFTQYLDVPECEDSDAWDPEAVKECAALAYDPKFGFVPTQVQAFVDACSPGAMCH